jgi:hypothetical protein
MALELHCECGNTLQVTASMCGTDTQCDCCYRNLRVPKLSQLGGVQENRPLYIANRLRTMKLDNNLPIGNLCVECGRLTSETLYCQVECETPHLKDPAQDFRSALITMVLGLFSPVLAMLHRNFRRTPSDEVVGNDLAVDTPIRLCSRCFKATRMNPNRCRELIARVPEYGELLEAYPNAQVFYGKRPA